MKEFLPDIIQAVGSILGIILIIALNALKNYLISKTQNENIIKVLNKADTALETLIRSNQQTLIDGLKKDAADGKITADELKERLKLIKHNTLESVMAILGEEGQEILDGAYKDSKEFLSHRLEAMVGDLKS